MFGLTPAVKPLATSLSVALLMATALPVTTVQAHDRHNASKHYGHGTHLSKKQHRKFHKRFGRGVHGQRAYRNIHAVPRYAKKKRKSDRRDLIAAGVIGLAVGAIIANESARRSHQPSYHSHGSSYGGNYGGTTYRDDYIPLEEYDRTYSNNEYQYRETGPRVITYNEPYSLEPWTPGWREWCENRYRSFNASTGTFRGYDGLDHFCVPK